MAQLLLERLRPLCQLLNLHEEEPVRQYNLQLRSAGGHGCWLIVRDHELFLMPEDITAGSPFDTTSPTVEHYRAFQYSTADPATVEQVVQLLTEIARSGVWPTETMHNKWYEAAQRVLDHGC